MRTAKLWAVAFVAALAVGCVAKMRMDNTSPTQPLPNVEYYEPIDATVHVHATGSEDTSDNDVAVALQNAGVFTDVRSSAHATGTPDFELRVTWRDESDHHFLEEMGEAVFSGLLLMIPSFFMTSEFDYRVEISGTLYREGREVAQYSGSGSYHSEVPDVGAPMTAPQSAGKAVTLSWEYALKELSVRMKQDRERIEAALRQGR